MARQRMRATDLNRPFPNGAGEFSPLGSTAGKTAGRGSGTLPPMSDSDTNEPISVPAEEPTEEQKHQWEEQSRLSEQITQTKDNLVREIEYAQQQVSNLYGSLPTSQGEFTNLAGSFTNIAGIASAGTQGLQDGVFSKQAFEKVAYWCHDAAQKATAADSLGAQEQHASLSDISNALSNAHAALSGV
jgi:hypothetical protein